VSVRCHVGASCMTCLGKVSCDVTVECVTNTPKDTFSDICFRTWCVRVRLTMGLPHHRTTTTMGRLRWSAVPAPSLTILELDELSTRSRQSVAGCPHYQEHNNTPPVGSNHLFPNLRSVCSGASLGIPSLNRILGRCPIPSRHCFTCLRVPGTRKVSSDLHNQSTEQ
jgi:hypothetical protein